MTGNLDCLDLTDGSDRGECLWFCQPVPTRQVSWWESATPNQEKELDEILLYYNVRIKSFSGRRRSLMIATIALMKTLNLPDAGNSTQRETVQEVPGVFNSQRRKERN